MLSINIKMFQLYLHAKQGEQLGSYKFTTENVVKMQLLIHGSMFRDFFFPPHIACLLIWQYSILKVRTLCSEIVCFPILHVYPLIQSQRWRPFSVPSTRLANHQTRNFKLTKKVILDRTQSVCLAPSTQASCSQSSSPLEYTEGCIS